MDTPITIDPGVSRLATLRALRDFATVNGYPPSLTVLALDRGLSVPGVKKQLDWMASRGLISKVKGQPRSAVVTDAGRKVLKNRRGG